MDLFEEVAKFRAARRLWSKLMKERFNCNDPGILGLRISVWTSGNRMLAQQPLNNLVRISVEVLAAILGGVEHIWAPAYDEALALPTSESTRIANQAKFIILHECGLENTMDPLGGSYYLEKLTNQIEEEARSWLEKIEGMGGVASAIKEDLYYKAEMEGLFQYQKEVESGQRLVVGINKFKSDEEIPIDIFHADPRDEQRQVKRVQRVRQKRNHAAVREGLEKLEEVTSEKANKKQVNIVPAMLNAVKANATVGEIYGVLRKAFGEYKPGRWRV
jgi:methylmalonyl-CoA mutase N-terminal domain/subunit